MSEKKDYWVTIPVDAHISVLVKDVESEEDAKVLAMGKDFSINLEPENEEDFIGLDHFETVPKVHQGNVCYLTKREIEAEEC